MHPVQARDIVLREYAQHGKLALAARAAGVSPSTAKRWVDTAPDTKDVSADEEGLAQMCLDKAVALLSKIETLDPKDASFAAGAVAKLVEKHQQLLGKEASETVILKEFGLNTPDEVDKLLDNLTRNTADATNEARPVNQSLAEVG